VLERAKSVRALDRAATAIGQNQVRLKSELHVSDRTENSGSYHNRNIDFSNSYFCHRVKYILYMLAG
jgi:hypothetical protein